MSNKPKGWKTLLHSRPLLPRKPSDTLEEVSAPQVSFAIVHSKGHQLNVASVAYRGPTQRIHAQLGEKRATSVANRIISPKYAGRRTQMTRDQSEPQQQTQNHTHVNTVTGAPVQDKTDSCSDDEYVYTLGPKTRVPETNVEINGVTVKMMIDTGASTDIIDDFTTICRSQATQLEEDTCRIFAYGSQSRLTTLGKFDADIVANGKRAKSTIHVLQGTHGSLLSFATASKLDLVDVIVRNVTTDTNLI